MTVRSGAIDPAHLTGTGELFVADNADVLVSLHSVRWLAKDLWLLHTDYETRNEDLLMGSDTPGRREYPEVVDATRFMLPFLITGHTNEYGQAVPESDAPGQLEATLDYLVENLTLNPGTLRGSRRAEWVRLSGATYGTMVKVHPLRSREHDHGIWRGDFDLTVMRPWELLP